MGTLSAALKRDPGKLAGPINRLMRQFRGRFDTLASEIRQSIVVNDCFGLETSLKRPMVLSAASPDSFSGPMSPEKLAAFLIWLRKREREDILDIDGEGDGFPDWSDERVRSYYAVAIAQEYQRSSLMMRQKLERLGYIAAGGAAMLLLRQGVMAENAKIVQADTYSRLTRTLTDMNEGIRTVVRDGMTSGLANAISKGMAPKEYARELWTKAEGRIAGGRKAADRIAHDEIASAHGAAFSAEMKQIRALGVDVKMRWLTSGLENVCAECEDLEGNVYPIEEFDMMYPAHSL